MGIRIVDTCGTLPTSLKDGNLIIYGFNKKPVAAIPLPFKAKPSGPYNDERMKYPNVMVVTPIDGGLILVMRYDGTYTIYTDDFRPKMFGKYDTDLWKRFIHVDRMGCFKHIPVGYKKERLYDAYVIRYEQSNAVHYTCVDHPTCKEIVNFNDQEVVDIFNKGLNLSSAGWPAFGEFQDCLYFDDYHLIPCEDITINYHGLQNKILYSGDTDRNTWNVMYRRRSYAEVVREVQTVFKPPAFIKEILDTSYLARFSRAVVDRDKEDITYQMACIMAEHQDFIFACELNGYTVLTVDEDGFTRYHRIYDSDTSVMDTEGTENVWVPIADTKYSLVGYVNTPVMEISTPTILPRVPYYQGTIFVGGREIPIPADMNISKVPDASLRGFHECINSGKSCVIYNEDFSYRIL